MAKGNPLLHRFNEIVTRMLEAGLIEKLQNDFMSSSILNDRPIYDDDDYEHINFSHFSTNELNTVYSTFSLIHLQVVFHFFLIGQTASSFIFLVEVLYYRARTTASTSTTLYSPQYDN
jgi:hypothetical protein